MLALACLALVLAPRSAQESFSTDTWIPVDTAVQELLTDGDAEAKAALGGGAGADLAWGKAFGAWTNALRESTPGAVVATGARDGVGELDSQLAALWPDRDESFERRHESIEYALLRRISGLPEEVRGRWTRQLEPQAEAVLASASADSTTRASDLAQLERQFPATRSAARAAIERFELAFEQGRVGVAQSWLVRAERHVNLAGASELEAALRARRAVLADGPRASREPAWANTANFESHEQHPLVLPGYHKPRAFARIDGPAGVCTLDEGRLVVQTSDRVWVLTPREEDRTFEPWTLTREPGMPAPRSVGRPGRDWPLRPTSDGEHLYIVAGRADGTTSNLVQRVLPGLKLELTEMIWSLGGDGLYDEDGKLESLTRLLGPGLWEFQPGPALAGDLLLVEARQWTQVEQDGMRYTNAPGEARSWLLALEISTGRPRWRRQVCRGTDILADLGQRFGRGELIRTPGAPPVVLEHRVFVGTNLGAGALIDLADGRLAWSFLATRRSPAQPGWQNSEPALVDSRDREGSGPATLLWAPRDAAELYSLHAGLDFDPGAEPLMAHAPLAIGESERLVGGDSEVVLTYGRSGGRRTLSAHVLESGRRYDSVFLGREERFLGRALIAEDKVLCLTDRGLYRFDRNRELYLEYVQPLVLDAQWTAGGLWASHDELLVLAGGGLLRFSTR